MLKYETNEVPAGLETYYEDAGNGVFKLKVEGVVPATEVQTYKSKVDEFRSTNIELKKRVDSLARFEEMFKTGAFSEEALSKKIEEQALLKAAEMKAAYEAQVSELTEKLTGTSSKLESIVLNNSVAAAALRHGVAESALEDVYARAKAAFKVVDGELTAADGSLDSKGNKLSIDNWMGVLAEKAPHLFKASSGASAFKPGKPIPAEPQRNAVDKISAGLARRR